MGKIPLTYPLFSYYVFADRLDAFPFYAEDNRKLLVSTINPHSFYLADHDQIFKTALEQSEILLPDGVGMVYANRLINGSKLKRISGMDLFLFLLRKLEAEESLSLKKIFFLGSTNETLGVIQKKINTEFPSLRVGSYSPPYKSDFSEEDLQGMINATNDFNPHVLFVGMTAPKQEKWSFTHKELLNVKIICSIGAVFDFYSGRIKRPGKAWQMLGLEWLGRFMREPRRLHKRYFISLPYFIFHVFKEAFSKRFLR